MLALDKNGQLVYKTRRTWWNTRGQAVARKADRTASQHLRGSRDVIGQVTIW